MLHVITFYHSESKSKPGTRNGVVEKRFIAIMITEPYDKYSIGMEIVLSKYRPQRSLNVTLSIDRSGPVAINVYFICTISAVL